MNFFLFIICNNIDAKKKNKEWITKKNKTNFAICFVNIYINIIYIYKQIDYANTRRLKSQQPVASAYPSGLTPNEDTRESCGISQILIPLNELHI